MKCMKCGKEAEYAPSMGPDDLRYVQVTFADGKIRLNNEYSLPAILIPWNSIMHILCGTCMMKLYNYIMNFTQG